MHRDDISLINRGQSISYGLRARLATGDYPRNFLQLKLVDEWLKIRHVCRRQDDYDLFDLPTLLKLPQRVDDDGDAVYREELLGPVTTETNAFPTGDDYRDVHSF